MAIEIIDKTLTEAQPDYPSRWAIVIEITDGIDTYLTTVSEPGTTAEGGLQAALEARETDLWSVAQQKAIAPDSVFTSDQENRIIKAFALVVLDEINLLRAEAALAERTVEQLRTAIKNKLKVI